MRTTRMMLAVAASVALGSSALLAQQAPGTATQTPTTAAPAQSVMIAGCVQKEADVLKRNPVAGSAGMDDEFVLTNAAVASPSTPAPTSDAAAPAAPTGTSGSLGNPGVVYRTTGDKEADLKSYVGQRVEISGSFKDKESLKDAMSSAGTSPRSELTPANTAEITIDSVKPIPGSCAPIIK